MPEPSPPSPGPRDSGAFRREARPVDPATRAVVRLAERQWGIVTWDQLRRTGMTSSSISRALHAGRLHRIYPRVYAVGHRVLTTRGRLAAGLFYAGPGAAISHATAAWWWELLPSPPGAIQISSPTRRRSAHGLEFHQPGQLERVFHRGFPVTPVPRTLLDLAASAPLSVVRRTLAEADFRSLLNPEAIRNVLRRGLPGSAKLRLALDRHLPQLAETLSMLEERFLVLCERSGLPLPEVNVAIAGLKVDVLWRPQGLVVELDGGAAHGTPSAVSRDRHRELVLRERGFRVLRYSFRQIVEEPGRVVADLRAALS
jgi:hypothetical protein